MDTYSAGIPCLIIGILEIFIIVHIYGECFLFVFLFQITILLITIFKGLDQFFDNLNKMTGWNPTTFIKSNIVVMISVIAPTVISIILYKELYTLFTNESALSYGSYKYPEWAGAVGWGISILSLMAIPIFMLLQTCNILCCSGNKYDSFRHRLKSLVQPTDLWWKNQNTYLQKANKLPSLKVDPTNGNGTKDSAIELSTSYSNLSTFNHSSSDSLTTNTNAETKANGHINAALDITEF